MMVLTHKRSKKARTHKKFLLIKTQKYFDKEWRGKKAFTFTELRIIHDFTVGCCKGPKYKRPFFGPLP